MALWPRKINHRAVARDLFPCHFHLNNGCDGHAHSDIEAKCVQMHPSTLHSRKVSDTFLPPARVLG